MFDFQNLDDSLRRLMLQAINEAAASNNVYLSTRFNSIGQTNWLRLLKQAAENHNEHWLAFQLETIGAFKATENVRKPSGGYTSKHIPHTASETIADGQFNRFYMLGLCKSASSIGKTHLEVYRAKTRNAPRTSAQTLIGSQIGIAEVESQLKTINSCLKSHLLKPNSGLSLRISD